MVCFARFEYHFTWAKRHEWSKLLCAVLPNVQLTLIVSSNDMSVNAICTPDKMDGKYEQLEKQTNGVITNEAVVSVQTERIWDSLVFWNVIPKYEPGNTKMVIRYSVPVVTDDEKDARAIQALIDFKSDPYHDVLVIKTLMMPFENIGTILETVHKTRPINRVFISPGMTNYAILFADGTMATGSYYELTNNARFVFDLDDGINTTAFPEMNHDLEAWKEEGTLDPETIIKLRLPQIQQS